ncbi:hypothetical protein GCM10017044_12170 [Kordiimonas sediminis]|uniref:DUF58 domain-containing protein n=1 Tax=Kordiimonas sediminis TaxID=1735581 RepID=A0A919APZ5_9PROT|nr:DUF58 domain-containing protein [Kordiimonas sediminis]GHF19183.1 hypothetical protein GCM10017044_12170 [Kordiimonas sediminis]
MERFLDPRTLSRIKDLPLVAKTVADGFLHGLHESRMRGVGVEFSQYRQYEEGDDLSRIDWKLFARSDRYFVREAERESEISVWFVVDASASMAVASEDADGWTKLDYAKHLIATMAYIAGRQGDSIGLMALYDDSAAITPLGTGDQHWSALLRKLVTVKPGQRFPAEDAAKQYLPLLQQHGMVFVLSDFYQEKSEIYDFVNRLAGKHTEVIAMKLNCDDEENFPFTGPVRFEDAETGEQILVNARDAQQIYKTARDAHTEEVRLTLLKRAIELTTINIDAPMDQALYDFLRNRSRVVR